MTRRRVILGSIAGVLLLSGCSTHERRFEATAPPRLPPLSDVRATTGTLIARGREVSARTTIDTLAALTRAASMQFHATGRRQMRVLTNHFADALLKRTAAVLNRDEYGTNGRWRISRASTLRAGLAFTEAYRVLRDSRYKPPVYAIARSVSIGALRVERYQGGYAMVVPGAARRGSVALTALAGQFMRRADALGVAEARGIANGAIRTVTRNQAAVGRWYADVGGKTPMTLDQWSTTLTALGSIPDADARGIVPAGVSALYAAAFDEHGAIRDDELPHDQPSVLATALQALASGPLQPLETQAFDAVVTRFRSSAAAPPDDAAEAELALAFAMWYQQLKNA